MKARLLLAFIVLGPALQADNFQSGTYQVIARRRPTQTSEIDLSGDESRKVAGASGDVLRAVAALPGVATANDYLANLLVRGGGSEDNLILLDGFPVSYPFHFGGVESVFHPGLIQSADFLPSGFDSRFGDAQGGVLELRSKRPADGAHGELGLSMILAGALASVADDAKALTAAYRRGYFDLVLDKNLLSTGLPRYQDYATRLSLGDFSLILFGSQDDLSVNNGSQTSHWESEFHTVGLSYDPRLGPWWLSIKAGASLARTVVDLGPDLNLNRRPYEWLGSIEAGADPGSTHEADFGISFRETRTMLQGTFKRLPVELGSDFDFNAAQTVNVDALGSKTVVSLWATDRWHVLDPFYLSFGTRFDHVDIGDESHFSPRVNAEWRFPTATVLKAALGDYFQSPNGLETVPGWTEGFSRGSTTRLYSVALEQSLASHLEFRTEAYHKDFERRIPNITLSSGSNSFVLNAANIGYSEGAEASLRLKPWHGAFGWLSYAWSNTQRSTTGVGGFYDADFSQPHVINAVASTSLGPHWDLGTRYRLASGIPYTPIASRSYDPLQARWIPVFGATNSARLDWYQRLDIRLQYSLDIRSTQLRLFTELYNALDWPNITSVTYKDDYSGILEVKQFPRFLFGGVEFEF